MKITFLLPISLCLALLFFRIEGRAQPNMYFSGMGALKVVVYFTQVSELIEFESDSVSTYNSPQYRRKILNVGYDTLSGLSFEKQYFLRCRYVNANGNPTSKWSTTIYNTATYPLEELFKQKTPIAILSTPIYKFLHRYSNYFELWYDTVPSFNSSQLKKFSSNTLYNYHQFSLIKNHKDYYLRAQVIDGSSSLPWKTIHVYNNFSPTLIFYSNGGCTDTSIAYFLYYSNYFYDAKSFSNKTYVKYGNYLDSSTSNSYGINIPIKDSNSVYFYNFTNIVYDSATLNYADTFVFRNILGSSSQNRYAFVSLPKNGINFSNNSCNTTIELELYSDSTLTTLLNQQSKSNGKVTADISFETNWDYFKKNVLRYRTIRFGMKSEWSYIYPKNYIPKITFNSLGAQDSTLSLWKIDRSFVHTGKKLEVLLDVNTSFNSPKLKTYLFNDTLGFELESLFDYFNYVKCRVTDGVQSTVWSNLAKKGFTFVPMHKSTMTITHPRANFYSNSHARINGVQLQMGTNPNLLKYNVIGDFFTFDDTFDFVNNETVYYRVRHFTAIDTSVWTNLKTLTYKTDGMICMSPVIVYNGNRFGKDTFDIRWKDRDSSSSSGNYLYFAKSPTPGSIEGIIEIPKGVNFINLRRRDYPIDWYYAVYPKCGYNKTYSQIATKWFPLNPLVSVGSSEEQYIQVFYNYDQRNLVSNSESTLEFSVFDLSGKSLFQGKIDSSTPVDLSSLNSGIYVVKVMNHNICKTFKIIVQ